jgi:uncharacterized protein YdhG (YjbR/CyaY superfamily)
MPKKTSTRRSPHAKGGDGAHDVDKYLAAVPEPGRSTLAAIRAALRVAMPSEATEGISYGIPVFKYKKVQLWYAAFSKHCSFFPGSLAVIAAFNKELKPYKVSKGTIRFPVDQHLSAALVKKLVKARVTEHERKEKQRKKKATRNGDRFALNQNA